MSLGVTKKYEDIGQGESNVTKMFRNFIIYSVLFFKFTGKSFVTYFE